MTSSSTSDLIPVTLLTGFLGSGKTTVLNHLVRQPELSNALVIINEFGEMALDHLLVAHSTENLVMEMSSGCLCCTIRGDLVKTLRDITWRFSREGHRQFDRVVIETTGLADPASIIHTLITHPQIARQYRLDGILTCVDMAAGMHTLDKHKEAVKQAALADTLLLTKSDITSAEKISSLRLRLKGINPGARQISVAGGEIEPEKILNLGLFSTQDKSPDVSRWLSEEAYLNDNHGHDHDHGHSHDLNRHDDHIRAFCFAINDPIDEDVLAGWLDVLMSFVGSNILRVKGVINVAGHEQPRVLHGVQHIFYPPALLPEWPGKDRRSRIVFITHNVGRDVIEKTFNAFVSR